ncbi:methylenetetrahydrofolate reductase [Bogoriella caseilytica]|uniref:Methylenetetrahydrofolate reductase n=1 Tax=Bogoriella caseilytica TaxID=56055 RepID=A0A3N2BFV8_9MICO|nr:methylenetetrahydrofolate reductase [Bogoriella caseilytica]ROR74151.1 5,10-methylenetetrahydrofolate reductase [Bogoriella caseilytica]
MSSPSLAPSAPSAVTPADAPSRSTAFLVQRTRRRTLISFEVFPPRPEVAPTQAWQAIDTMAQAGPDYFSVTHGHQQSAHAHRELIRHLLEHTEVPVLAHLICAGRTQDDLRALVAGLITEGVRDFLALRGDPLPGATEWVDEPSGFNRAAELVRAIRQIEEERLHPPAGIGARPISISVAAYPRSGAPRDYSRDLHALWEKQEAGADYAITQVFYDAEDYARLVDDARSQGIHLPIVAGIAPLTSAKRLQRLQQITGVPVPEHLLAHLEGVDEAELGRRGVAATLHLIDAVLELGCPGLHLFTFNRYRAPLSILEHLRIRDAARQHRAGTAAASAATALP